jgi:hypothetical protein
MQKNACGVGKKSAKWCFETESDVAMMSFRDDCAIFFCAMVDFFVDNTLREGLSSSWSEFSTDVRV